ncbi:MAG: hypothetical protein WC451_02630 [Patescibacteria group bacterium]
MSVSSEYILNIVTPALRFAAQKNQLLSALQISEMQETIQTFVDEKKWGRLIPYLKNAQETHSVDLSRAIKYCYIMGIKLNTGQQDRLIQPDMDVYKALMERLQDNRKQLIYIEDMKIDYDEAKEIIRAAIRERFEESQEEIIENRYCFPFLISRNFETTGEILLRNSDKKQSVVLVSLDYAMDGHGRPNLYIRLFGEKNTRKNMIDYSEDFYMFSFVGDNKQTYMVLSRDILPEGHCTLGGMLVKLPDEIRVGTTATTLTNLSVIFSTDAVSDLKKIDEKEFKEITREWEHEKLASMVFGKGRHPQFFEKLVLAWLFSGKFSDYPLHLFWIGPTGSAKTQSLTSIVEYAMGENRWDGTSATTLSLMPSYGQANVEPGYLIRQRNVGAGDEFFSGFLRSSKKHNRLGEDTALMTSILEHKKVSLGSGKHSVVYAQARAKFMFCTNPEGSRLATLSDCARELPRQFMSRFLWYVQTKSHLEFIAKNKAAIGRLSANEVYPVPSNDFKKVYEYLNSFTVDIPEDVEQGIFNKYKDILPDDLLQEVYAGRSHHHILCLIDGISKYNSIVEHRPEVRCMRKDIDDADTIFGLIISTWNENVEILKLSEEQRVQYMPATAQLILEKICNEPGLNAYEIGKKIHISSVEYWLEYLIKYGLLKFVEVQNGALTPIKRYYAWNVFLELESFCPPKEPPTS